MIISRQISSFMCTIVFPIFILFDGQGFAQQSIYLSKEGKAQAVIVTADMQTVTLQFAAEELAKYLKCITGDDFLVLKKDELNKATIRLELKEGSGIEDYKISVEDNKNIVLAGNSDRAILYAVYDLLERLECVWMAPDFHFYNGNNEHIPSRPTLVYKHKADIDKSPDLKYRKIYIEEGLSHNLQNLPQMIEWMPKGGYNTMVFPLDFRGRGEVEWDNWRGGLIPQLQKRGITIEVGGHGYQNFLNADMENGTLFKKHPEWFGMEDGKRSRAERRIFCTSNSEAVDYVHFQLLKYLKERPEIDIFDFWPPDGGRWCECSECEKIGTSADQHARLVNLTSDFFAEHLPGLKIEAIAYARTRELPKRYDIDEDVLIDFCPISQSFEEQIYNSTEGSNYTYRKNIIDWKTAFQGDFSIYSYYRKYQWRSLPVLLPYYMQNDLQWYKSQGVAGISTYAEPADWYTYELNHYVLGKLAWDVNADVGKLIDTFAQARYGDAAETAVFVYQTLEDVVRFATNIVGTSMKTVEEYDRHLERMNIAQKKLEEASPEFASATVIPEYLDRIGVSVKYATLNILIQQNEAADGPQSRKKELVDKKIELIEANEGKGVFLIHPRLQGDRLYSYFNLEKPKN